MTREALIRASKGWLYRSCYKLERIHPDPVVRKSLPARYKSLSATPRNTCRNTWRAYVLAELSKSSQLVTPSLSAGPSVKRLETVLIGLNERGMIAARALSSRFQPGVQFRQPGDCRAAQPLRLAHNLLVLAALRSGQENIDHILDRPHGPCEQEGKGLRHPSPPAVSPPNRQRPRRRAFAPQPPRRR